MRSFLAFLPAAVLLAASPIALEPHRIGSVSIQLPKAWRVDSNDAQGSLQARRNAGDPGSPVVSLNISHLDATITEDGMIRFVISSLPGGLREKGRTALPAGQGTLVVLSQAGAADCAFVVQLRPKDRAVAVTSLTAPHAAFVEVGGEALLRRIAASLEFGTASSPAATATPSAAAPHVAAGTYLASATVESKTPGFSAAELPGRWGEGSGSTLEIREDSFINGYVNVREVNRSGTSSIFIFKPDHTYQLTEVVGAASIGCSGMSAVTEVGSYSLDGATLTIQPAQYKGWAYACKPSDKETVAGRKPPARQYTIYTAVMRAIAMRGIGATNRALVLHGSCAGHLAETCRGGSTEFHLQRLP